MINSDAIVTLARSVVELFGESKIQDKLKSVIYHSLIIIMFYVSHVVIIVEPHLKLLTVLDDSASYISSMYKSCMLC